MRGITQFVGGSLLIALFSTTAQAQGTVKHFSEGVAHSGQAIGHSVAGTVKLSAAVVAAPLKMSGAVGQVSGKAGDSLIDFADKPIGEPLPITDEAITAGPPPAAALQAKEF